MVELIVAKMLSLGKGEKPPKRRWNCPSDATIAAYVDSVLGESERARVQVHLAVCAHCRSLVSDVVKQTRETDVPETPAVLLERARALVATKPKRWAWSWGPATVAGVLGSAAIAVIFLRTQSLPLPEWPAPAVPILSESKPTVPPAPPLPETLRKPVSLEHSPAIIFPQPDSVIARQRLEFRWTAVQDSIYYHIRVLTMDGGLVWEADSTATDIKFPHRVSLNRGKYFVLVSAVLRNGRAAKSSPVEFQVEDSK